MGISKIYVNNNLKIDLTKTTATAEDVAVGKEFYNKQGDLVQGSFQVPEPVVKPGIVYSDDFFNVVADSSWYPQAAGRLDTYLPENLAQIKNLGAMNSFVLFNTAVKEHHLWWPDQQVIVGESFVYDYPWCNWYIHTNNLENFIKSMCTEDRDNYYTSYFVGCKLLNNAGQLYTDITIPEGIKSTLGLSLKYDNNQDSFSYKLYFPSTIQTITSDLLSNNGGGISLIDLTKVPSPPSLAMDISYWMDTDAQVLIPLSLLEAYKSASNWSNCNYLVPVTDETITIYINDVAYTGKQTTWAEFISIHPELNITVDSYGRLSNLIEPTIDYYNNVYSNQLLKPDAHYSKN